MIQLSIIVPFYNVEEYIEECIRSFYNQDIPLSEYEVICVNDCSPDNSVEIVKKLQKEYSNLILIEHTENKKQGGARNTGLRYAKGEYIWFVDSDDYVIPNVLNLLCTSALNNTLDILQFDYISDKKVTFSNEKSMKTIKSGEEYLFEDNSPIWYDKICGPWRQLFKRQFLVENNLQFVENVQYEDTDYILKAFLLANKVQYLVVKSYYYRIINTSTTSLFTMSPYKIAWKINQITRCCKLINDAKTILGQKTISLLVSNTLSEMRNDFRNKSLKWKIKYLKVLDFDINICRKYVSWRTWLVIRYCITWFI